MRSVGAYSTSLPSQKKAVWSETRAACCMLCVTMTIVYLRLQLIHELFDSLGRDRIQRRRRFVHQQNLRLNRERARNAQPLLLSARQRNRRIVQPVLDFVPDAPRPSGSPRRAPAAPPRLARQPVDPQAVGDVLENRLRERVGLLKHHADAPAQRDDVGGRRIDVRCRR